MADIKVKNWFGKLLCKHKNKGWYVKRSMFYMLEGELHYQVCKDCGKELDQQFIKYD